MSVLKKILINKDNTCQPIWFMRQAGRYLPEFREIRKKNPDFIKLCLNPDLVNEITLQPLKRFNLDAAIIFSDILMIPYGLGQKVEFKKGEGPILGEYEEKNILSTEDVDVIKKITPIYQAIKQVKNKTKKNIIGFAGAPWTLLVYMLNKKSPKENFDFNFITKDKLLVKKLLEKLISTIVFHIIKQIEAGADVIQIFDSWAGLLPKKDLTEYCFDPTVEILKRVKKFGVPIVCFPKGIKESYIDFNNIVKPDGLNLDYEIDPVWAKNNLTNVVLQGGMDPKVLLKSQEEIYKEAKKYLDIFKDVPYIFNLGHGLVPETDPNKLEKLVKFAREHK
jgi:uroporphyrinogen decarboxylase